jgi:catechol 2,3-dioxygenase-like lactoylglutathione lyase family enzyme
MTGSRDRGASVTEVGTVFVPVSDHERALDFYVERLGFEKRSDFEYGGSNRWIEVAPPGSTVSLALVSSAEGAATPSEAARCALATDDIEAMVETLSQLGVEVEEVGRAGGTRRGLLSREVSIADPFPPQCCFCDPDGNRFLLVQPT